MGVARRRRSHRTWIRAEACDQKEVVSSQPHISGQPHTGEQLTSASFVVSSCNVVSHSARKGVILASCLRTLPRMSACMCRAT